MWRSIGAHTTHRQAKKEATAPLLACAMVRRKHDAASSSSGKVEGRKGSAAAVALPPIQTVTGKSGMIRADIQCAGTSRQRKSEHERGGIKHNVKGDSTSAAMVRERQDKRREKREARRRQPRHTSAYGERDDSGLCEKVRATCTPSQRRRDVDDEPPISLTTRMREVETNTLTFPFTHTHTHTPAGVEWRKREGNAFFCSPSRDRTLFHSLLKRLLDACSLAKRQQQVAGSRVVRSKTAHAEDGKCGAALRAGSAARHSIPP